MEEQRERDIEGHIIVGNNTANKQQWAKSETEQSPSKHLTDSNFEAVKELLFPEVIEENNNLKEENRQQQEKIENLTDENSKLHRALSEQVLLVQEYKDKLEKLQKVFDENSQEGVMINSDGLKFTYNITNFSEYIKIEQIDFLFLQLQKLVDIKIAPNKYLINNAAAVVPIYIILTSSSKIPETFKYKGSMQDFCNEWNSNVVAYITDKERAKAITCNSESFEREHRKEPWRNTSPATWRKDIIVKSNKLKLDRAINIKIHLENLLVARKSSC